MEFALQIGVILYASSARLVYVSFDSVVAVVVVVVVVVVVLLCCVVVVVVVDTAVA